MASEAVEHFFTPQQEASIVESIRRAEKSTSGEVRVHIEEGDLRVEVLRRSAEVFDALGMTATALHNGVLFYLDIRNHRLAIWGGQGIYEAVPHGFWDEEYRLIARAARRENSPRDFARPSNRSVKNSAPTSRTKRTT